MINDLRFIAFLCLVIVLPWTATAQEPAPDYGESLQLAIDHAVNPAGWNPSSLFVIPDTTAGATEGLIYDGGKLVVRTATKSRNFKWNYVGEANYRIYGSPTTDATWVTTGNDAMKFLLANSVTGDNVTKLLERGLGMDATGTHDAIVEFAVDTQYLMRPTRNPDISQYLPAQYGTNLPFVKPAGMSEGAFNNFKAYYENWMAGAYGPYAFPWTQLGYTFFWGNGYTLARINGMSEFIILGQSPADIYGIYATRSYIYTRNDGSNFSSAANASYGNGFASFKIDGTCDTVWAGHRFQKNVRTGAATPNQVVVESSGTVSGGQGILIWSLNYDVVNSGVISGATADKFGMAGTSDVAVLFKGDTGTGYGTPVMSGVNRLTNSGIISSPGTAIMAEAGNTIITNNTSGAISGGTYAIRTGAGDDAVTVNGGEITGKVDLGTGTDAFSVTNTGGNAKLNFTLNRDAADSAQVLVKDAGAGTVNIADNTKLAATVAGTTNVRNHDRFLIVDTDALTVTPANLVIQNDGSLPMVSFTAEKDGNKLYLVAARNAVYYGANSGNASLGALLDTLADTATGDMATVLGNLDKSGNAANARKLEPIVDGGIINASSGTMNRFTGAVVSRIDQIMADRAVGAEMPTGISTGDETENTGVWAQGFGAVMHQGQRGASGGYDANLWGLSFGFDRFVYDHLIAGFSGGYAHNRITTGDAGTRTDADSYQGSFYGSLARDAYYIDGVLSFAYNRYDALRHVAFGAIDRTAKSNYAGRQYSGYLESGYIFNKQGYLLTPLVSLQYMGLHIDDYAETGAGALNLSVAAQDYNMFQTGLGFKIVRPISHGEVQILPELHAKWLYDFVGDRQQTTSTFTGGGGSFATNGFDPPKSSYHAGAKVNLITKSGLTLSLNYDFEWKEDFYSHSGYFNVRYTF
jgi:outer membrane autotransporter protein